MAYILGIDAAWTETEPSGVALIEFDDHVSKVICVAPSYQQFVRAGQGTPIDWNLHKIGGSPPNIAELLGAARNLGTESVQLIAFDIPLARTAITSRRASDKAVSKAFGSKGCSTHSPSTTRPGPISDDLLQQLGDAGLPLETCLRVPDDAPRAIEVYPHPALLTLLKRDYRIPYKVSKTTKYWKGESIERRKALLLNEFGDIYRSLEVDLGALSFCLPRTEEVATMSQLKRFEDALDALVCAWVGIQHLLGQTTPYGDHNSAIWIP